MFLSRAHAFRRTAARLAILLPLSLLPGLAPSAAPGSPLAESISPYLRLHADDPVAWREWSPALLEEARATGRPLLVSSGYYACHWCHVMQEESFRDKGIAERLNRDFIPVKIDRDLHGALDHYLLEFLRATLGSAGWPLNVVILPTGDALAGVVYAPRDDFAAFLDRVSDRLRTQGEPLATLAREARMELKARLREGEEPLSESRAARLPQALWAAMEREADLLAGGFGSQSKFPQAPALEALLRALDEGRAPGWAAEFLGVTLDEMAGAGLRDVLGGGFFRYSETPDWGRPHFEVMLEDQAQLARVYLRAARLLARPDWADVGLETLHFVLGEMSLNGHAGFASALSALDDTGREGGAYLWTPEQVAAALRDHPGPEVVSAYFGLDGVPTFDAGHLPKRRVSLESVAERFELPVERARELVAHGRRDLLEARRARGLPRDEKPVTGLHGLLLSALAEAYAEPELAEAGEALAGRLRRLAERPEELSLLLDLRHEVAGAAELADYAYVARGLHDWALATGDDTGSAVTGLLEAAWEGFADAEGWRASREQPLPGMIAQRFHPSLHRPSPSTELLALSRYHRDQSALIADRLADFDARPGRAIETVPIPHAGLILLPAGG
jgi:uncharacterized protein